jgi:hypothetical protein
MVRMTFLALSLALGTIAGCAPVAAPPSGPAPTSGAVQPDLRTAMRTLWADHVIWTRAFIVAAVSDDPSAPTALARLLRNQEDIGNAVVPFYGAAAGARLTELLKEHITIAGDLVTAAKAGNTAAQADADRRWHSNAGDIATFLSDANPHWPRATLVSMLNTHLALTTQEAVARLQRDWNGDVAAFDRIFAQAMEMADALTDGIRAQFPGRA